MPATTENRGGDPPRGPALGPIVLLVIGIAGISTSSLWRRLSESEPTELAFRRLVLTVPILWLFARLRARESAPAEVARGAVLASGVCLAVHFAAFYASLDRLSTAVAIVVVSMHPVLLVALEVLVARGSARPGSGRFIGAALAVLGTIWLAREEHERASGSVAGILLGLASSLAMVGYLLAGRRACRELPPTVYAQRAYGIAAVWLGIGIFATGDDLLPESAHEWRIAALCALFPTLLGHTPMNASLRHIPASVVSTAFLGEVVGASLLVWAFLDESPPSGFWAGGAAIAAGIWLASRSTRR